MVFAPFTGVDNHKRCITFAVGLLFKEDEESYTWLFRNFLKAMGHEPHYIITDQDPAMKKLIQVVFENTKHRLCMWHIMEKVSVKVGHEVFKNEDFKARLNGIVWNNDIEPAKFEEKWKGIMEDYGLSTHTWFNNMFEIRNSWIPAYFRDVSLWGLLRTTSRSESANSSFGSFTNPQVNLVEFFMHFESAMDAQRHATDKLNSLCATYSPECKTPLDIEAHAASIYSKTMFPVVRAEIAAACFRCVDKHIDDDGPIWRHTISDADNGMIVVRLHKTDNFSRCSCKMFEREGLVCRHIFALLKDLPVIPEKYVLKRWMKSELLFPIPNSAVLDKQKGNDEYKTIKNKLWSDFAYCIRIADGDKNRLDKLSRVIEEQKQQLLGGEDVGTGEASKQAMIETFCGSVADLNIEVLPPKQAKNKGSGSRVKNRMQSEREKAIKKSNKLKRRCGTCGDIGSHNSRTCDKKNKAT